MRATKSKQPGSSPLPQTAGQQPAAPHEASSQLAPAGKRTSERAISLALARRLLAKQSLKAAARLAAGLSAGSDEVN